jgi:hypothetical protein
VHAVQKNIDQMRFLKEMKTQKHVVVRQLMKFKLSDNLEKTVFTKFTVPVFKKHIQSHALMDAPR